jgi:hypothetical protein
MTLRAVHADRERRRWPLSERIVDENLGSYHHVPQQPKRPRSAKVDAEVLGSRSADLAEGDDDVGDRSAGRSGRVAKMGCR